MYRCGAAAPLCISGTKYVYNSRLKRGGSSANPGAESYISIDITNIILQLVQLITVPEQDYSIWFIRFCYPETGRIQQC